MYAFRDRFPGHSIAHDTLADRIERRAAPLERALDEANALDDRIGDLMDLTVGSDVEGALQDFRDGLADLIGDTIKPALDVVRTGAEYDD